MFIEFETSGETHRIEICISKYDTHTERIGGNTVYDDNIEFMIQGIPEGTTEDEIIEFAMEEHREDLFREYYTPMVEIY